jgi:hypothetical protein
MITPGSMLLSKGSTLEFWSHGVLMPAKVLTGFCH